VTLVINWSQGLTGQRVQQFGSPGPGGSSQRERAGDVEPAFASGLSEPDWPSLGGTCHERARRERSDLPRGHRAGHGGGGSPERAPAWYQHSTLDEGSAGRPRTGAPALPSRGGSSSTPCRPGRKPGADSESERALPKEERLGDGLRGTWRVTDRRPNGGLHLIERLSISSTTATHTHTLRRVTWQ